MCSMSNMRFRKGSMVEVLTKNKDLIGAWRCATIVEGNGDGYTVRYYRYPGIAKEGVDKVSVEAVRPRAPPVTGSAVWAVGDIVEVLDDGFWRVSLIEEVVEDDCYYIQVVGSVDEFKVKKSSTRARQEWKDKQWVLIGKDSDKKLNSWINNLAYMQRQREFTNVKEVKESVELPKTLKRSNVDYLSTGKASSECVQKRRAVDKEVARHTVDDSYSFIGKVDTLVNLRVTQGKDEVKIGSNNAYNRNHDDPKPLGRTSEADDCISSRSSVGSCSTVDASPDRSATNSSASCSQCNDSFRSDAESVEHKGGDEATSVDQSKPEDTLRMHELALYRYRSTLESLYACGPLSWELESYLTNLRLKYSVSTDEHLTELRRLKSIGGLGLSCY